jgi:hypothetical protein
MCVRDIYMVVVCVTGRMPEQHAQQVSIMSYERQEVLRTGSNPAG